MEYPKISLVTACFNHKEYIGETIKSILSQQYPNLQYIVIDDGSTDGSWEIINSFKNSSYSCERLEGYRDSVTIALNHGLSKVDGQIMGWLNSDDILLPKSLFTIAEIFSNLPEVDWLTGMSTTINFESHIVNSKLRLKNIYDYLSGDWQVIQQESTFWRRSLWESVGGKLNETGRWAFDTELWTRFFEKTEHYHVTTPLGAFRYGKQSKSVSDKSSFLIPNQNYLQKMKERVSKKLKIEAFFYRSLKKIFFPILGLLPHKIFQKFSYKLIEYSFKNNTWQIKRVNPFKKIY